MNVQLWLNGKRLAATSDAARGMTTRFWNSPWLVPMPIDAAGGAETADAPRVVHLRVTAVAANDGGLSALWWGGAEALRARHEALSFVRVTLPAWCVAFGLSLGLVFVFVWMHNHTQQPWGYFGAASVVWGLSNLNLTLTRVPMPDAWWETCVQLFNFLGPWLLILFGFSFTGALTRRLAPWLWAHAALTSAFLLATNDQSTHWKSPLVTAPLLILGFWALITIARWIRLNAVSAGLLFPTVASVTFIAASHDWAIQAGLISVEQPFLLVLASPLLLSTIAWLLAADYARAQHGLQQLNLDLDSRVRAREAQLQTSFEHQGRIESALAVAEERTRILRDIHDGAGSHLSTAIRLIEHGTAQPAAVAQTLREALDQLKLSIDTLNVLPGDVVALLANLRYRLEPRMADAGITLLWSIDALPPWPGGQRERAMQNLQFIMFEIVSNVLQHAHATALRVEAAVSNTGRTIRLTFADNGKGLAPSSSAVPPLITTIRKRVAMIGATLDVADANPGLSLVIELPLEG
jgi:signal transduction histidine kinase